ncbi:4Fe-4S binding protein [Schinkia azotoformans]|uniref:4Fe-4S binding protein n=1 Tax=Schinkia azotoformans TaxID=1454 RepID=UPI002DB7C44E|nr:4Fe-4S binding protein [Schinkia azotoformans]MEC1743336.1 4Fe-4S binding protein [Schinkia azotoformans]MEC1769494.1 4Fe-4S binding protein [Schinkia azotoformans]MEC1788658.1 4Fe-4S binding protein [Schinkia azotoformans]MED4377330.1 4Fe-4S binding protein [Schinkia azotoformans]MED4420167.1 4Fe-4S binding protein [Schinkia azotoformans]
MKQSNNLPKYPFELDEQNQQPKKRTNNILNYPLVKKFMISKWYPGIFQWITLVVFSVIVYQLVAGTVSSHDNFGTTMTWVLWWPLIPIMFLVLGRFWCAICPFGKLSDLVRKFAGSERPMPKFLKKYGIWLIDLFFILITWSDHIWGIVGSPRGSGYLLLILTTMVVGTSILYERRTFCKTLCFLGGLAGNYSRAGMLELRGTPDICKSCKTQSCFKGSEKAEGCPMFQYVRTMDSSAECNLCANCIKSCPNDSIRVSFRKPTSELWGIKKPKLEHTVLAAVIMGIVFVQNITMLSVWQDILKAISKITGTTAYPVNFTVAFIISMIIPVAMLWITSLLVSNKKNMQSVKEYFVKFGYAIIPLDLAGHIAHNLFHILTEGKAIGYNTLALFGMKMQAGDLAFTSTFTVQVLQFIIIGLGFFGSAYTVYKMSSKQTIKKMIPFYALMFVFAIANIYLFTLPMDHRVH